MNILYIINNLGSGGAEKLIEETLPLMNKKEGIEVSVLLLSDNNNVFDNKLKDKGIKIDVIPLRKTMSLTNVNYIRKYIIKGKYDVVHAHLFPTIYWTSIASKLMLKNKPKFIYTEHSTHNRRRNKEFLRPLEKWIYSSYDKIISISDSTQENLVKWLKIKQKNINKFAVINNGININKFRGQCLNFHFLMDIIEGDYPKLIFQLTEFDESDNGITIKSVSGKLFGQILNGRIEYLVIGLI